MSFVSGVTRELQQVATRLAQKYGKSADEILSDPKLRQEAEREVASQVRFRKDQPATADDVSRMSSDRPKSLSGAVRKSDVPAVIDTKFSDSVPDTSPMPSVDADASSLRKKVRNAAAVAGAGGAMAYGVTGSWADDAKPAEVTRSEPLAASSADPDREAVERGSPLYGSTTKKPEESKKKKSTVAAVASKGPENKSSQPDPEPEAPSRDSLRAALRKEYDADNERTTWAELANTLGRAGAQYGAARAGLRKGVDMSNLGFAESPDFDKTRDRRQKEYLTERGALDDLDKEEMRAKREEMLEKGRDERNSKSIEAQNARAAAERREQAERDEKRRQQDLQVMSVKDLQAQEKELTDQLKAAKEVASVLAREGDLSPKTLQKIEVKMPGAIGKAGITPGELEAITAETTEDGWFSDSVDVKKRNELLQERLITKRQMDLTALRTAIDKRLSGGAAPASTGTPPKEPTPDQINKYVSLNKGVSADQAREILRKRLNP